MLTRIQRKERIQHRIRKVVNGTVDRPRMAVYRSNKQIYVQFIDDVAGKTLASASSLHKDIAEQVKTLSGVETAKIVGKLAAEIALTKGISTVVFDRGGYLYHGKIKNLAESARQAGLKF